MRRATGWPDRRIWVILFCALLTGCQGVSVWRVWSSPRVFPTLGGDRAARDRVDRWGLDGGTPPAWPGSGGISGSSDGPDALLAAAVANHRAGRAARKASRELAARYELDAIAGASAALSAIPRPSRPDGPGSVEDVRTLEARDIYNASLEDVLELTGGRRIHPDDRWRERLGAQGILVAEPGEGDDAPWSPERFDELLFAEDYVVRGMAHQYRTDGIGVPMIAVRRFNPLELERRQGEERFLMPREVYPVTAVLRVDPASGGGNAQASGFRLELLDPLGTPRPRRVIGAQPMAKDLTTPLAYHLARSALPLLQEVGLLDPGWLEDLQGLYMLHPYQPGKIPIVFVHGLRSSPLAWLKVINEIQGDPVLRDRYQVWLYMYPTGFAFLSSAARLRKDLGELRELIDPQHTDLMLDRMVMVGHSMGGLISKMMILESGDAVWRLFSNRPFEELNAPPERREKLRQSLFFSPNPSVARIVFIATPHRGSQMGDEFIGWLADRLIRLPRTLRSTYRTMMASNDPEFFTPMLKDGIPSSIDELRLDNPLLMTLSQLPRRAEVPVHSIIGRQDPDMPLEESTDGVVPYQSAHIDWARSECIVNGDHACQDIPETIREIRRILRLHLEESTRPALR